MSAPARLEMSDFEICSVNIVFYNLIDCHSRGGGNPD